MNDESRRRAIVTMHTSEAARAAPEKTFICIGVARGGTSAVGGAMQRLGVFMGTDLPENYEDPDFVAKPLPHMKATIAQRNRDHQVWGFKAPSAANYLEHLLPGLRNPHLVVVYRDLVATMKAHVRWHNRSQMFAAHEIMMQQQKNWFLVERWKVPTALVSYEKTVLAPDLFARALAEFLDVPQPETAALQDLAAFLSPGRYK